MSNSFNLDLFRKTYQGPNRKVETGRGGKCCCVSTGHPFTSSKEVWDYFSALEDEPREVVIATYLDNKHHVLRLKKYRGEL